MSLFSRKPPVVLGLDIGSDSVKLLQLSRAGKSYRVDHAMVEPLPEGAVVEHAISQPRHVADAIKQALRRSGAKAKHCAVAVSGSAVITKTLNLPADLNEDEIEGQIEVEANQYIPFPRDEVSLDFEVLGPSARNAELVEVLLAASKTEVVDSRQQVAEMAGLATSLVDVEAFAVGNAFELVRKRDGISDSETCGVFDLGATVTTLVVMRAGRVVYTREHPFGGRQLSEEIARRYDLGGDAARFLENGAEPPEGFESEVLAPFRQNVVQQISRALQFYSSSSDYSPLGVLFLGGGCAAIPGLVEQVGNEIGIECKLADPLKGMRIAGRIKREQLDRQMPAMMVACGLALRGFD